MDVSFKKYVVITGNYGSGKTELALNLALRFARAGENTVLVDMDIVNPYFRSSGKRTLLEEAGVRVISPQYANKNIDMFSLSGEIYAPFDNPPDHAVFDVGGDNTGAAALGMLKDQFLAHGDEVEFLFVVNAARPLQYSADSVMNIMREIEKSAGINITGVVNNANLARDTDLQTIEAGEALAREVAEKAGVELKFSAVREDLAGLSELKTLQKVFPIRVYMRPDWLDEIY